MPDAERCAGIAVPASADSQKIEPEYSHAVPATVRVLPHGESQTARLLGWRGLMIEMQFPNPPAPGAPLEIESGSTLYWGELQTCTEGIGLVLVEHSLDRAALETERDQWE